MFPELFSIGPFHFHSWGLMMVIGFSTAFQLAKWAARSAGLKNEHLVPMLGVAFLSGMIGSHLLEIVINPRLSFGDIRQVLAISTGLTEMGGILFGLAGLYVYLRWRGERALAYLDAFALATPLGLGWGRVGCFLAGCCYGRPTSLPWAVVYTNPQSLATAVLGIPVHPAPLYMLMAMWSLCATLLLVRFYSRGDGRVFLGFWVGYPAIRFFQEMVRADPDRGVWFQGAITSYQLLCLLILAIAVPAALYLMAHRSRPAVAAEAS